MIDSLPDLHLYKLLTQTVAQPKTSRVKYSDVQTTSVNLEEVLLFLGVVGSLLIVGAVFSVAQ